MTSVTFGPAGFVGGGYRDDPARGRASGAIWSSRDGGRWTLEAQQGAFDNGRVLGLAASGDRLVAVGTVGDATYGPAAAWVHAGGPWRRATVDDTGGAMRAVAATGTGFVAVGLRPGDAGAKVWTSHDGMRWEAVPDQPAFHAAGPARMLAVASAPDGVIVATGWRADAGNGSSVAWTARDPSSWRQEPWQASFSGGQMPGLTFADARFVAVGRTGYPDNNQATIWVGRVAASP
jgi:hypothetical protein